MNGPVEIMGAAAEAAAWNGHHSESAPATRLLAFFLASADVTTNSRKDAVLVCAES